MWWRGSSGDGGDGALIFKDKLFQFELVAEVLLSLAFLDNLRSLQEMKLVIIPRLIKSHIRRDSRLGAISLEMGSNLVYNGSATNLRITYKPLQYRIFTDFIASLIVLDGVWVALTMLLHCLRVLVLVSGYGCSSTPNRCLAKMQQDECCCSE